ncbi:MAG: hypothetical protein PHC66_03755 [Candidatus Nanoarchaeia archaeon]|nr:hypothetical protein [Candidatus Nanoarchaeia archaeon]MDD5239210.1 hypothetical protein [Candidatus Nanoarchaeia archaeon]
MNKKAFFETVIGLVIAVTVSVIVLYLLLAQGVAGPAKTSVYSLACTASSYSRGILLEVIMKIINVLSSTYASIYGTAYGIIAAIVLIPAGGVLGAPGVAGAAYGGYMEGIDQADAFSLELLSTFPLVCPPSTVDIGKVEAGKESAPEEFYKVLAGSLIDARDIMGNGRYDPLAGADPPNPRAIFILETHLDKSVTFNDAYDALLKMYPNKTDWFKGNDEEMRLYLYCAGESKGNNFASFSGCSIKDSIVYIMYKDDHKYDLYTAGTSICYPALYNDAKAYSDLAKENRESWIHMGEYSDEERQGDIVHDGISGNSPWEYAHDAVVVCIEAI